MIDFTVLSLKTSFFHDTLGQYVLPPCVQYSHTCPGEVKHSHSVALYKQDMSKQVNNAFFLLNDAIWEPLLADNSMFMRRFASTFFLPKLEVSNLTNYNKRKY